MEWIALFVCNEAIYPAWQEGCGVFKVTMGNIIIADVYFIHRVYCYGGVSTILTSLYYLCLPGVRDIGCILDIKGRSAKVVSPTFAIRGEKRLFLGMNRHKTLDFKGVDIQNGL